MPAPAKTPDPRNLNASELARILNSTSLGQVTSTSTLRYQKDSAGSRIGTGTTFNAFKYFAWLLGERHKPAKTGRSYEQLKAEQTLKSREESQAARDIAPLPKVKNQERRDACKNNFRLFCDTYFQNVFNMAWSADHLAAIERIESCILQGGLFAFAMPRGSGKTSICECATLWAVIFGHRQFVAVVGSSEKHAKEMLETIKMHMEANPFLADDFPESIYPIVKLDGISKRCQGQLFQGNRTHISWADNEIIMPTIPNSPASGSIIQTTGMTGAGIRGCKHLTADGQMIRPSLVIVDDPQTDESARSREQCITRERILSGAILGMAGPGKKIAGFMPCTVIRAGDVADNILDRKKHPEWQGQRTKLIYDFPKNTELWKTYADLRADGMRAGRGLTDATAFYNANRNLMDDGARIAWAERFEPGEISAIQNAMNLQLRDPKSFDAEYQNDPAPDRPELDTVNAASIMEKISGRARGEVPIGCSHVTAFIDIQQTLLYFAVCAWGDDFTGYVLDYGSYPDQKRDYFTLADAQNTLEIVTPGAGMEGQIYQGLENLTTKLLGGEWQRGDGSAMKISSCMIDANWGPTTDLVYRFCRQSGHAAVLTPSHGRYAGAASKPFSEYTKKPGDRVGINWRIPVLSGGKREIRHILFDTNYWKSFVFSRLQTHIGDRGSLSLFGKKPNEHQCFADHLTAEYRVRTEGRGRAVDEWKLRPGANDNHWLDCVVGCAVGAAMQGATLTEVGAGGTVKRKKVAVDMSKI